MYYMSLSSRLPAHFFFCSLLFLFFSFLSIPAALPGCPNLVRYYDAWYEDNQGVLFVQMEFLQGGTLSELARKRRLTEVDARRAICDIARALDHMHARGIGHLDVKPDNILALTEIQWEGMPPAEQGQILAQLQALTSSDRWL